MHNIKEVELITTAVAEGVEYPLEDPYFQVTFNDGYISSVPIDLGNRHYWEVKAWYDAQQTKPFEVQFEELPEPNFAETIYPEPEEAEEEINPEEIAPPEEPQTLLPK